MAATCLPLRDGSAGLEILMVQRNPELSFGGMWTFPGGGLEPGDGPQPESIDEDAQEWMDEQLVLTASNAAARETLEETALHCSADSLQLYSHWIPPSKHGPPKRFATWFFLAQEVTGSIDLDTRENAEARWVTPETAMDHFESGEFPMAVPTWVTLDDLRACSSIASVVTSAREHGPRLHHTTTFRTADGAVLAWEGDIALSHGVDAPGPRNRVLMGRDGSLERMLDAN
jgi:8-oxo-dGTP pyrophosphatase MutT (NUDIX family)